MSDNANPFRPGAGRDPPYLAGRENELRIFDEILRNTVSGSGVNNMLLYGLRGVGKTVLLRKFVDMCSAKKFLPVAWYQYGACDSDPSAFSMNIELILRNAIESASKVESAKGKIRSAGHHIKPKAVGIPGVVHYEPSYARDVQEPLAIQLPGHLARNSKIIDELGYDGAAFILDEFHTINDVKKNRWRTLSDFIGAINDAQSQGHRYSLVLSGLPVLVKNVKTARSYSERMFRPVEISNLADHDARQAIIRPLDNTHRKFSRELVDAVVADTQGYPFFIQFFACEILQRIDKNEVGLQEYRDMRNSIIAKLFGDFFDQRLVDISPKEKNTLYCMSDMDDANMRFSSVLKRVGGTKGYVSSHLKRLETKGLVYRHNHGLYKFALPLLRQYLIAMARAEGEPGRTGASGRL